MDQFDSPPSDKPPEKDNWIESFIARLFALIRGMGRKE